MISFAPPGLNPIFPWRPTACATGYSLTPLRGLGDQRYTPTMKVVYFLAVKFPTGWNGRIMGCPKKGGSSMGISLLAGYKTGRRTSRFLRDLTGKKEEGKVFPIRVYG